MATGKPVDVGSLEAVRGERCADRCAQAADGYTYCAWDTQRAGCREGDWLDRLPSVFGCAQRGGPVPVLLFNGNLDPFSSPLLPGGVNNSGMVSFATNSCSE